MNQRAVDSWLVVYFLASSMVWCAATVVVSAENQKTETDAPILVAVKRIWDKAPHNAFTDLLRFQDRWYCVFREGTAHVSPDGSLRVITSTDGRRWKSIALVTSSTYDLRDAKLAVTPDGRLMLNGAGMIADAKVRYQSMCWFSTDAGHTWDDGRKIGDPGFWLWRTQWYDDVAYTMGYNTQRDRTKRTLRLYKSTDGHTFETHVRRVPAPNGCGEDKILFLADKSALCLLRHKRATRWRSLAPPSRHTRIGNGAISMCALVVRI